MESHFLDLLHAEELIGNRVGGTFTSHAYCNILAEMQGAYGSGINKKHLKNKIRAFKQNYSEFKDAFCRIADFSWNWDTKKFDAEDSMWEALIKENANATCLRGKNCLHWDDMITLWSSSRASGNSTYTAREHSSRLHRQFQEMSKEGQAQSTSAPNYSVNRARSYSESLPNAPLDQPMHDVSTSQPSSCSSKTNMKQKAAVEFALHSVGIGISESLETVSRVIVESGRIMANKMNRPPDRSEHLFKALEYILLEPDYLIECYQHLNKDDEAAAMFLGVALNFRESMLTWIMSDRLK